MAEITAGVHVTFQSFSQSTPLKVWVGDESTNPGVPIFLKYSSSQYVSVDGDIITGLSLTAPKSNDGTVTFSYSSSSLSEEARLVELTKKQNKIQSAFSLPDTFLGKKLEVAKFD
ncbi:MAG: hypothetical protein HQL74_16215 [Magnetococcales bacterium]|nr:hypothetical protein [Magnetococcales bacterium]